MKRLAVLCALSLLLPLTCRAANGRYKGDAYTAVIASPPGLYSNTRLFALVGGDLREVRLSKAPDQRFFPGERIGFTAQEKEGGGEAFLLANPKSIRPLEVSATSTFMHVAAWPERAGACRFEAEVVSKNRSILTVRLSGVEGDVLAPAALTGPLAAGDIVGIEGYVSSGPRPRVVLPSVEALTLSKTFLPPAAAAPPTPALSWPAAIGLILIAALIGGYAYLRHQRLQRLALAPERFGECGDS